MTRAHWIIIAIVIFVVIILPAIFILIRKYRRHKARAKLNERWRSVGEKCQSKKTWPEAIVAADELLDYVLKNRGFKGVSMGERLVSARQSLTDNDLVWFAHKLRDKLAHGEAVKLTKPIVKKAIKGTRQALIDLGAL